MRMAMVVTLALCGLARTAFGADRPVPSTVEFTTEDGGVVYADVYGSGERAVLLAHGGRFTKESWAKQAPVLVRAGFEVMAIDFRGRGKSNGPGGMDASEASIFYKKYGFYVKLSIVDDPVKARDLFASGHSHILWGTLDMIALFAPELAKDSRTVPVICQQRISVAMPNLAE